MQRHSLDAAHEQPRNGCATRELLAEFAGGRLSDDDSVVLARHVDGCRHCQTVLDEISDISLVEEFRKCHDQAADATNDVTTAELVQPLYAIHQGGGASPSAVEAPAIVESPPLSELGRFRVLKRLGAGGFGVVYLAHDTQLNRQVALKVPRAGSLADQEASERFLREMRAAAGLHHPQIVAVYDAGRLEGVYFLAAEYCPGPTLLEWVGTRGGRISPREAATIVLALAEAAHHAHEHGVIHRDIKPQNVLLDPTARYRELPFCPKLTDFSVAKLLEADNDATATNVLVGTPRYMAPEQVSGRRDLIGPACDVYTLGVVLYELATGRPPIRGDGSADTLRRVLQDEPERLRRHVAETPRDLEAIALKCLEKAPQRRYASAELLAGDLRRFLAGEPTLVRPVGAWERGLRWVRRRPATGGLIAAAILGGLALMGGLLLYNARLNDFNASLDKTNADLETALADARRAQSRAAASERRTQQLLYFADMRLAARAWRDGDIRVMSSLLRRHIPRAGQFDRRGLEWRYLWNLADAAPRRLASGAETVYYLGTSPDERWLARAGKEDIVTIHDVSAGKVEKTIDTGQGEVNCAAFSPDGELLATAGDDGRVKVWRLADQSLVLSIDAHQELAFQAVFAENGTRLITCGNDPLIHIWDAQSGEHVAKLEGHSDKVEAISLSPDGRLLASAGSDGLMKVWSLGELRQVGELAAPAALMAVAFTPDGRGILTASTDGAVILVDSETCRIVAQGAHHDPLRSVTISAGGGLAVSGDSLGVLTLWELPSLNVPAAASAGDAPRELKRLRRWQGHQGRIYALAPAAGDDVISAGEDGTIKLWRTTAGGRFMSADMEIGLDPPVFTADQRLIVQANRIAVFRPGDKKLQSDATSPFAGEIMMLAESRDRLAGLDYEGGATIWEMSGELAAALSSERLGTEAREIGLTPDGTRLAVLRGPPHREVRLIDIASGEVQCRMTVTDGAVKFLRVSPDGQHLALLRNNDLILYDYSANRTYQLPTGHDNANCIAFSRDGELLATGGSDRLIKLWHIESQRQIGELSGHRGEVSGVCFSPDRQTLLSAGGDGLLKLWSVAEREEILDLHQQAGAGLSCVSVSHDGRWIAATSHSAQKLVVFDVGPPTDEKRRRRP